VKSNSGRKKRYKSVLFSFNNSEMDSYLAWFDRTHKTKAPYPPPEGEFNFNSWWFAYYLNHRDEFEKGKNIDTKIPFSLLPPRGKAHNKLYFIKCDGCNTVFGCTERKFQYCPTCLNERKNNLQRIHRGAQTCKHCGKPLPKKYPNRKYCSGACRTAACRERRKNIVFPISSGAQ